MLKESEEEQQQKIADATEKGRVVQEAIDARQKWLDDFSEAARKVLIYEHLFRSNQTTSVSEEPISEPELESP